MKKRGKKGVSNLIAIVIIILVCIILTNVVYNLIIQEIKGKTFQIESKIEAISNIDMKILSISFLGNDLKIVVENSGQQDISSFIVRVTSITGGIYLNDSVYIAEKQKLKPLETKYVLIIPAPFGNNSENYSKIEVYPRFEFQGKEEIAEAAKDEISGSRISGGGGGGGSDGDGTTEPTENGDTTTSLDFKKGVYSVDFGIDGTSSKTADLDLKDRINYLATLGVDIIQIYQISYSLIIANSSTESGKALRANNQKLWVKLDGHGGVLENNIDEKETDLTFLSDKTIFSAFFSDFKYSDNSYKTFWLDNECIQFDSFSMSSISISGYAKYRTIFYGIKRGCEGTIPERHNNGSIPVNVEHVDKTMRAYGSPELIDSIFGYYAADEPPIHNVHYVNFSGMQKIKYNIVRKYDSSNPIIYGQMAYSPIETWWLKGTTDYTYVDALALRHYPWKLSGRNDTQKITELYEDIRKLSKQSKMPKIYAVVQVFTDLKNWRLPTKQEVKEEIDLHLSLNASGIMFYTAGYSNDLPGIIDYPHLQEAIEEFNP